MPAMDILKRASGTKKNSCCVVIPSGHSPELLEKHLKYLQAQDTKKFDVLVIGKAPNKTPAGLNLLIYSEVNPIGSSGAFGLGQVLAYTLGYKYIVNADIDCFPISKNVMSLLLERVEETGKVILPASVFDSTWDMATTNKNFIINHYAMVPREIYEQYGFANFRFFKGGEDWELQCRLQMEDAIIREPRILVEHKSFQSNQIDTMQLPGSKYIYYSKNYILANMLLSSYAFRNYRFFVAFKYFFVTSCAFLMYWLIYHNYKDLLTPIILDGLTFNVDARYPARASAIATISSKGKTGVILSVEGENISNQASSNMLKLKSTGIMFKQGIKVKQGNRLFGAIYLLKKYLEIAVSGADYVRPTKQFLDEYKFFIQYLILLRPIEYIDGKIYTEKMGALKLFFNIAVFVLAYPVFALLILLNIAYATICLPFPITVANIEENIKKFSEVK